MVRTKRNFFLAAASAAMFALGVAAVPATADAHPGFGGGHAGGFGGGFHGGPGFHGGVGFHGGYGYHGYGFRGGYGYHGYGFRGGFYPGYGIRGYVGCPYTYVYPFAVGCAAPLYPYPYYPY
jgi:hypothetical protein